MSVAILCGLGAFAGAQDISEVPELPPLEVKGIWSQHGLTVPIAVKVVAPEVPPRMTGTEVRMIFRIMEDGHITTIRDDAGAFDDNERNLAAMMRSVLKYWEFTPPYNTEGEPVAVRVALPVIVVEKGKGNAGHYSCVFAKEPIFLAILDR